MERGTRQLTEEEQAVVLRFEQELKSLKGQPEIAILAFGQRLMLEIFDAYVRGSPAFRRHVRGMRRWLYHDSRFLVGDSELETLEKRLIWETIFGPHSEAADPDWMNGIYHTCDMAQQNGVSEEDIASLLRWVAERYLQKGNWDYECFMIAVADYKSKYGTTLNLLKRSGVRIAKSKLDWEAFGSWFIEIETPKPVRVVWDGKEHMLCVQTRTGKTFAGMPEWEDRWASKELAIDECVGKVLQILKE